MTERDQGGPKGTVGRIVDERVSRRASLAMGLGLAVAGCGSDPAAGTSDTTGGGAPPAGTGTTPPAPGPMPPQPGPTEPVPTTALGGIDHIVVLMMENRSFDHYLGALKSDAAYVSKATVDGLNGTETNPDPADQPVTVFKMDNFTPEDPPHSWNRAHEQWNNGANDGFVKAHAGASQDEVMGYHDRSQLPLYYWFADNFAICDAWHASLLGPTWPNRFYLHATTSGGKKTNEGFNIGGPATIWEKLKEKGVSAKNYTAGAVAWFQGGFLGKSFSGAGPALAKMDTFFADAKAGTLPAFSLIDPDFSASDDHPSHNILRGQAFIASVYKALAESPKWGKTLFVITYDEHGGFYDHVAPPTTVDELPEFAQLGFRVPAFVIGPTVKKGYVCKTRLEHSSVAATLKTRFGIGSLTPRMDATSDITDCIDMTKIAAPSPPPAGMPVVAMTREAALYDGVGHESQPGLADLANRGLIARVDDRPHTARIAAWLKEAVRLGAVRLV